jgi:phage-related baseplate assembly protein
MATSTYTPIDLSALPAPTVVESLSFETILSQMVADLQARDSSFTALVESDPAYKILEVCAYRELLIRQRVNDSAKAVMLAYAIGSDLDHLGGLMGVTRKTLVAADPAALPPVEAVMESDDDLRKRIQLSVEGLSTAGPVGSYIYHALSVTSVKDVAVNNPSAGVVQIVVLANRATGIPTSGELAEVSAALNEEHIRPLTDTVQVQAADVLTYTVTATIFVNAGPDASTVLANCNESIADYVDSQFRLDNDINLSGIYSALHIDGVTKVTLAAPSDNIAVTSLQAARCTAINLTLG